MFVISGLVLKRKYDLDIRYKNFPHTPGISPTLSPYKSNKSYYYPNITGYPKNFHTPKELSLPCPPYTLRQLYLTTIQITYTAVGKEGAK